MKNVKAFGMAAIGIRQSDETASVVPQRLGILARRVISAVAANIAQLDDALLGARV